MIDYGYIIAISVCVVLQGFFEGSEMALVNADKMKIATAVDAGSKKALMALHLIKRPARFFSTTLIGSNVASVTAATIATFYIINNYGPSYAAFALLLWPVTLVFGQIVPKSIFQRNADKMALRVAPILFVFSIVLYPFVYVFSKLTDSLLGKVKKRAMKSSISREDIEDIIEIGEPGTSDVKQSEKTLISRIFDLADKKVENIMTPLVDVIAISKDATLDEAAKILEEHGFSRVPVFDKRILNVVGVIVATDVMFAEEGARVNTLMKSAYFVPEEMPLDELLMDMKREGEPIAVAVDEYGAATGIVTLEDLLEEIVGEIHDEHDDVPKNFIRVGKHRALLRGRMEIEEANERLKLGIETGDYETIAGFVISQLEKIPEVGESFVYNNYEYKVVRSSDRAVLEVEVSRKASNV